MVDELPVLTREREASEEITLGLTQKKKTERKSLSEGKKKKKNREQIVLGGAKAKNVMENRRVWVEVVHTGN